MSEISGLKLYSIGIVVENKPRGTDYILVTPIESLNIQNQGPIKEYSKRFEGSKSELDSVGFTTEHTSTNYIRAKWLPHGETNRITPPDVKVNETVLIYKFANVDEYYWIDVFREPSLRRLEDVTTSYSNKKDGQDPYDKDSSYFIRYNTVDKFIHLHTSSNDGEHCGYDIRIDTKSGSIDIKDTKGNFILFNSADNSLTANFSKDINLIAGNNVNISAGSSINNNAGSSIVNSAPSISDSCNTKSDSSGTLVNSANTIINNASSIVNNTPLVRNTGNTDTAGSAMANPNLNAVCR